MTDCDFKADIDIVGVDDILPYGDNPKRHPDEQIEKIASSIQRFGWDQPIVVDAGQTIIKGHARYQAAKRLGLEQVPVITQTGLSEAEVRAARIADNRVAESGWDDDLLSTELDFIDDCGLDLAVSGMGDNEIDDLIERSDDRHFLDDVVNGERTSAEGNADTGSINAATYVELSFSVTPDEREEVNAALEQADGDTRADKLLSIINEFK